MIKSIRLQNFFSFRDTTIELNPDVNILVGINGSGKTNLLKAIQLFREVTSGNDLRDLISSWGGYDAIAFAGKSREKLGSEGITLSFEMYSNPSAISGSVIFYTIQLTSEEALNFSLTEHIHLSYKNGREVTAMISGGELIEYDLNSNPKNIDLGEWKFTQSSAFFNDFPWEAQDRQLIRSIKGLTELYEVFDTTKNAPLRKPAFASAEYRLNKNAGNLVPVLNYLKGEHLVNYKEIEEKIKQINENFIGLDYVFFGGNAELTIHEKGLNKPIRIAHISEGTLRYICLLAIFNNPNRGNVVCIDEPETGLHPDMIRGIAKSIQEAGETSQMIISTHSESLVNHFRLENILVFEKDETNATIVNRFTEEEFAGWYKEFYPGKMWVSGDIGGTRW